MVMPQQNNSKRGGIFSPSSSLSLWCRPESVTAKRLSLSGLTADRIALYILAVVLLFSLLMASNMLYHYHSTSLMFGLLWQKQQEEAQALAQHQEHGQQQGRATTTSAMTRALMTSRMSSNNRRLGGGGGSGSTRSNKNNKEVCLGHHRQNFAPPSSQSKISLEMQKKFIQEGLYEKIAKGSGYIHAAGPILQTLSHVQTMDLHLYGSLGELGVHHGRFTSFLYMTARQTEQLIAVDLFEELQEANIDLSGMGNFRKFAQGLALYGLQPDQHVQIVKSSTADLPLDFDSSSSSFLQGFRLWSIDAGHTAELTRRDLQLVFCNLLPGGIVVLDDWFHPHWPGVVEGFYQFANLDRDLFHAGNDDKHDINNNNSNDPFVFPFLLCESKLYMTNDKAAHDLYLKTLLNDPVLSQWVTLFAQVGRQRAGKAWPYQMAGGTLYVRCDHDKLPSPEQARQVWIQRLATKTPTSTTQNQSQQQ